MPEGFDPENRAPRRLLGPGLDFASRDEGMIRRHAAAGQASSHVLVRAGVRRPAADETRRAAPPGERPEKKASDALRFSVSFPRAQSAPEDGLEVSPLPFRR